MEAHTHTRTDQAMLGNREINAEDPQGGASLISSVENAVKLAVDSALDSVQPDGHWFGELKSNVTITAEYIFLLQALQLDLEADREAYRRYLLSEQKADGSWDLAPEYPGDVSTTTEAYLALKILRTPADSPAMERARIFVLGSGGVAAVRVFTRIFLATFGLFPWDAVPQLPVELILLPAISPINIFKFSSWARGTIAPLLIICHHRPIYELPNGRSRQNAFLDELWLNPSQKTVSYASPLLSLLWKRDQAAFAFTLVDKALHILGGLRSLPFVRSYARRQCVKWILERQEPSGDWGGIFPPMHASIYAFVLEGFRLDDPPVRRGIEALENFAWRDHAGKRIQPCVSPVWDTILMTIGLCDALVPPDSEPLVRSVNWVKARQLLGSEGDWRIYRPQLAPGGFSFEYYNSWYPDVDDTAAVIIGFIKQDTMSVSSSEVTKAAEWVLGMQNPDGGWAAFDVENDKLFLNKIPFSDMDSLCDPSTADVTGRVLEAFGLMIHSGEKILNQGLLYRLRRACGRAISYLISIQEETGAWFGRWGSNYIY